MESFDVQFDSLGWSYSRNGGNLRVFCSEAQALYLIGAIKRAVAICHVPACLRMMEHTEEVLREQTYEVD